MGKGWVSLFFAAAGLAKRVRKRYYARENWRMVGRWNNV